MNLEQLKREMPFKWKPSNKVGKKMNCVAYIDARQARDTLDSVCGPENWASQYEEIKGNIYCGIGIRVKLRDDCYEWVYKWDCGTESNTEREKGEASDAFKRACVCWGIGRFLYEMKMVRLDVDTSTGKDRVKDRQGNILWSGADITDYINSMRQSSVPAKPAGRPMNFGATPPSTPTDTPVPPEAEHVSAEGRYNKNKGGKEVVYSKSHNFSEDSIKKVQSLEKEGKKGKEVLLDHLKAFNEANKTEYSKISDLDDDTLKKLITFIEDTPPSNI